MTSTSLRSVGSGRSRILVRSDETNAPRRSRRMLKRQRSGSANRVAANQWADQRLRFVAATGSNRAGPVGAGSVEVPGAVRYRFFYFGM